MPKVTWVVGNVVWVL